MNGIRIAISVFIVILIALAVAGWIWTGSHQTPEQWMASRVVLSIAALSGVVGLVAIWRVRRPAH